jgi:CRISPR/Cas system type I-B associated protein Csh2 (Cas7 group RAMP superfamily)
MIQQLSLGFNVINLKGVIAKNIAVGRTGTMQKNVLRCFEAIPCYIQGGIASAAQQASHLISKFSEAGSQ